MVPAYTHDGTTWLSNPVSPGLPMHAHADAGLVISAPVVDRHDRGRPRTICG